MAKPEVPNFGVLLGPTIESVPEQAFCALLYGLERAAALRYRSWAESLPEHAEVLIACAAREEEIADKVEALFPLDAAGQEAVDKALPEAIAIYNNTFAPYPVLDQIYLQSEAELQGAAAWVGVAAGVEDTDAKQILARCSGLEEENSRAAKELLSAVGYE